MTKPLIPADLLKSVTTGKAAGSKDSGNPSAKSKEAHPRTGITPKASTKPVKSTMTQSRSTNRGK
jgi:hypothetical protein